MDSNKFDYFIKNFAGQLPIGVSFDLVERTFKIGGREARMYFVDGLTDGEKCQLLLNFMLNITENRINYIHTSDDFISTVFPFLDSAATDVIEDAVIALYSGLVPVLVDGLDKIIIADARHYPQRSVEEPEKEKTLRGAKDGFTENFMSDLGLIRRRIRDNRLIFRKFTIGEKSKSDVALCYMKELADPILVTKIEKGLSEIKVDSLTASDQTVIEHLLTYLNSSGFSGRFNPFPKVRYTQRPDVVTAHITEGKVAIIVDNSPTVMLLPVSIFDFSQDADDYYFPVITGNYFRALRIFNVFLIMLLSPIYYLITEEQMQIPFNTDFLMPTDNFAIPVFWQLILLEISIDGLKLASLNTPESLGTSLSVIGALILGQFSVDAGWFIPQTIVIMAIVALATFTQPSIELSYGMKFIRLILLFGAYIGQIYGLLAGALIGIIIIASTRTIHGFSYVYPLVPFKWAALKKLIFRTVK